jgi:hypothetical protein
MSRCDYPSHRRRLAIGLTIQVPVCWRQGVGWTASPNKEYLDSSSQENRVVVSSWTSGLAWLLRAIGVAKRTDCKRICGLSVRIALSDPGP